MCGSKLIKKIHKLHDPLDLDNKLLDPLGLPSINGKENGIIQDPVDIGSSQVSTTPQAPTEVDAGVLAARNDERRRRLAAAGLSSTILTSSSGLSSQANAGQKTLLGA